MIVTIIGYNFDNERASSNVKFNNVEASEYINWNDKFIKVRVPDNVTSGYLTVNKPRISSNQIEYYVVLQPIIESITPQLANIGDKISINGKNFGNNSSTVLINWRPAQIVNWSDNVIEVIIPDSCTCGDVYVITSDSVYSNPYDYKLKDCGSRKDFNNINRVRVGGFLSQVFDTTYRINNDTISIYIYYPNDKPPTDIYNRRIHIQLILYPGSLNIEHFKVDYLRFLPCSPWMCYEGYILEGIDIPLNYYSQSNFKYIIDNQHPEKFLKATTGKGEILWNPKTGPYYQESTGSYDLNNLQPIIITFYK